MGRQEISACSVEILSFAGGDMDKPPDTDSADQSSSQCFGLSLKARPHVQHCLVPVECRKLHEHLSVMQQAYGTGS